MHYLLPVSRLCTAKFFSQRDGIPYTLCKNQILQQMVLVTNRLFSVIENFVCCWNECKENEKELPWLLSVYSKSALDLTSPVLATRPAVNTHTCCNCCTCKNYVLEHFSIC
jgi:hypothetical protein